MHIKKQNTQLRQLEAAAKDAEQTAETAQQQYQRHVQQLQSQLDQAQATATATDMVSPPGTAEAEAALHAELQSLRRQLAEAEQEVTSLQQQQAKGGSASVLPSSNPSTPSRTSAPLPAEDSAASGPAAQDSSTASAEKESNKDTQLQVFTMLQELLTAPTAPAHIAL